MITKHVGPTIALNKCKVCVHISRCLYLSVTVYPFLVSDIHVCVYIYIYISRKSPVSTKCLFTAPRPRDRIKAAVAYCADKLRAKTHIRLGQCIIKIWQQVTTIYNSCYAYFVFFVEAGQIREPHQGVLGRHCHNGYVWRWEWGVFFGSHQRGRASNFLRHGAPGHQPDMSQPRCRTWWLFGSGAAGWGRWVQC